MAIASRLNRLSRGLNRRLAYILPLLVLVGAVWLRVNDPPAIQALRNYAFDGFQRLEPRPWIPDVVPVRIVDIDEASLREIGQWPWPRTKHAELVDKLTEAGAAVIAFDVMFPEPDRTSPKSLLASLAGEIDAETISRLRSAAADHDALFSESIQRSGRVVLGISVDLGTVPDNVRGLPKKRGRTAHTGDDPKPYVGQWDYAIRNIPQLEDAAEGNGTVTTDILDVIRYVPLFFALKDEEQPFATLSIEALRVLQGATTYVIASSNSTNARAFGSASGISEIKVGEIIIPTMRNGALRLYDTGHKKERYISAADVIAGRFDPEKVDGHIVFIGTSAAGLKDIRITPLETAVAGVEVHAQLIEQIFLLWKGAEILKSPEVPPAVRDMVARANLERPDWGDGAEVIYLVVVALLILILLPRLSAGQMATVGLIATAIGVLIPWLLFRYDGKLFDPIYPSATVATMYLFASAFSFIQTELSRSQIRGAFGMYLTPALVEHLARNPDKLQLGGETREITVMFTDVRGFTTISEGFDAQELTSFMNRVLTPMTDIILSSHGTIDKYMGDAIMAFWNAPLDEPEHAQRACDAALEMQARLKVLNREWQAEAEKAGRRHVEVHIGVGLNSGPASVGNFGSTQRFSYSVMGDAVNLASRLEGQCKTYAVDVVLGEKTRQKAPQFAGLEIDLIMVKGKTVPERVFTLVGKPELSASPAFKDLEAAQTRVLERYRAGRFEEAIQAIAEAEQAVAALEWSTGYFAMMRERCHHLIEEPPEEWNGVFVAKEK